MWHFFTTPQECHNIRGVLFSWMRGLVLQGKRWISRSRKCVQNALIASVLDSDGATCDSLREDGFDSRPLCYEKTGFCQSIARQPANKDALQDVYELNDADTQRALAQVIKTISSVISGASLLTRVDLISD